MIESIRLSDFQRFQEIEVELSPHVTTFVGTNDVGKSTLLRALRWVCLNKPSGGRIIRVGGKQAIVEIRADGSDVERKRSEDANTYALDGTVFRAFNQTVPDEIAKLLNVADLNFQRQLDPHLWFADTAGQVARELNGIINLELIDTSLAQAAAHVRACRQATERAQTKLQRARNDRDRLAWALEADEAYGAVEGLEKAAQQAHAKAADLAQRITRASLAQARAVRLSSGAKLMDAALEAAKAAQEAEQRAADLSAKLGKLRKLDTQRKEVKKWLNETEVKLASVKTCPVCNRPLAPLRS